MALKTQLKIQTAQKLSPQQMQVVKLLECTGLELEERIHTELDENPALELADDGMDEDLAEAADLNVDNDNNDEATDSDDGRDVLDAYMEAEDADDDSYNGYEADSGYQRQLSVDEDFNEVLNNQLSMLPLSDMQKKLGAYIIGNLDEDGYLRRSMRELQGDLLIGGIEVSETDLFEALANVQSLDPPGIGARKLDECLLLQLQRKPLTAAVDLAMRLLEEALEAFLNQQWEKATEALQCTRVQLDEALAEIRLLNPKPGYAISGGGMFKQSATVIPDFYYDAETRELSLAAGNTPPLRISSAYQQLFKQYEADSSANKMQREAASFTKQKVESARQFIENLRQRNDMLLKSMQVILRSQQAFFDSAGDESLLKPLTMKTVADKVGCDVSTISRVSNSKYIDTGFGVFPLKKFFVDGYVTADGEEVSTDEVRDQLSRLVAGEDKSDPLSDDKLCEQMKALGYPVARRTIAKYRDQLGIPSSRDRKQ